MPELIFYGFIKEEADSGEFTSRKDCAILFVIAGKEQKLEANRWNS